MKYLKPFDAQSWKCSYYLGQEMERHKGRSRLSLMDFQSSFVSTLFASVFLSASAMMCLSSLAWIFITSSGLFVPMATMGSAVIFLFFTTLSSDPPSWFARLSAKLFNRKVNMDEVIDAISKEDWDNPILRRVFDNPQRFAVVSSSDIEARHAHYQTLACDHPCVKVWKNWLARTNPIRQEDLEALDHLERMEAIAVSRTGPSVQENAQKIAREHLVNAMNGMAEVNVVNIEDDEHICSKDVPVLGAQQSA